MEAQFSEAHSLGSSPILGASNRGLGGTACSPGAGPLIWDFMVANGLHQVKQLTRPL